MKNLNEYDFQFMEINEMVKVNGGVNGLPQVEATTYWLLAGTAISLAEGIGEGFEEGLEYFMRIWKD